jgi:autotransporter-associated beta strand protein
MEPRHVLATILWDGGGDGTTLTQAANWAGDIVPGAADDAVIDIAATPTITHTTAGGTFSVNSLTCAENFTMSGGTLTVAAASSFSGVATISGGTLSGTGTVTIQSGGTLNMAGGFIPKLSPVNAGTINWSSGRIGGGSAPGYTITNQAGAVFSSTAANVSLNGNAGPNASLVNQGTLNVNAGTLRLQGGGGLGSAVVLAAATTLELSGGAFSHVTGTISGSGTTRFQGGTHTLTGVLTVSTLTSIDSTAFTGAGDLVLSAVTDWNSGSMTGTGTTTIATDATVNLVGGHASFDAVAGLTTNNGTINLSLGGVFEVTPLGGVFTNNGTFHVGRSRALLVSGDFTQGAGGVLDLDVQGASNTLFGRVLVTGAATLDGTVAFNFVGGFNPPLGVTFDFLNAVTRTGQFATTTLPAMTGKVGVVLYLATGARLAIQAA